MKRFLSLVFVVVSSSILSIGFSSEVSAEERPKVVILGFDGVDGDLTQQWMEEGKLPNLSRLAEQGTFSPMRVTIPSQTPVSWSTFSTGLNPGRHGVFDFLRRNADNYQPSFGFMDKVTVPFLWGKKTPWVLGGLVALGLTLLLWLVLKLLRMRTGRAVWVAGTLGLLAGVGTHLAADRLLPESQPKPVNFQQGATFWEVLGDAGVRTKVVRMPVTFPPEPFAHGHLLSGMGTPDLSARIGKPFYFTSELFFTPRNGGDFSIEVVELFDNRGEIPTEIKGPPNELFPDQGDYVNIPMNLTVSEDRSQLHIDVSGSQLSMKPGDWSDWVSFTFPFNEVVKIQGIGRFRLLSLEPEVRLYLSPIQFDPTSLPPSLEITTPGDYAGELADRFGLFKTIGWTIDTWSLTDGTIDEEVFMEDVAFTVKKDEEMFYGMLEDDDWDVLMYYFEFTDRVQHMMFRFFDPEHPLYTEEGAEKWSGTILQAYQDMDRIVGEALGRKPEGAHLVVASDHGFSSFRRSMNYNTWLVKNGFMTLTGQETGRKSLEDLFDEGEFLVNVDWSKTKAYALGLGQIYINLAGREAQGIVQPEDYAAVAAEIKAGLESYVDPETGENPVAYVFTRDEAFGAYDPAHVSDLIPSNNDGYRVGWQDSLGGFGQEIVEPNTRIWSGDHCSVYPPLVEGIFFSTLDLKDRQPYMADVMPTLLDIYDVAAPVELDGKSLL
ncbi:MAG: alkaline phosphatase family protein [Deltaproteobacteria bacterium]|nr:alkaline phosphatase family protein [Deltaproteobacteria bacterium]